LRDEFPFLKKIMLALWSKSNYLGSFGRVSEETVKRYIAAQKDHD